MTMHINTKAHGEIEVDERQRVRIPSGLFGFEELQDWVVLDSSRPPFYWLQSLERAEVAFVLIEPRLFRADYLPAADPAELAEIGMEEGEEPLVFAIVTIPDDPSRMTANLQGPLLIGRRSRMGRQCISTDPRWGVRHAILQEYAEAGKQAC